MTRGRKPKYDTPQAMETVIEEYFKEQEQRHKPPTIMGLVRVLGFEDRTSLRDYKAKDKFSHIINNAKRRVEEAAEEALFGRDSFRGAQFVLRVNYGWTEPKDDTANDSHFIIINDIPKGSALNANRAQEALLDDPTGLQ